MENEDDLPTIIQNLADKYNVHYYELVVIISDVLGLHDEFSEDLFMIHEALTEVLNHDKSSILLNYIPSTLLTQ